MTDLPGFADPVMDAQACFRAVLDAMAHPGRVMPVGPLAAPAPLAAATAAVLLTLADGDTPVWLGPGMAAAWDWVRFHCGAPEAGLGEAAFAASLDLPALDGCQWGSHDGPEAGATLILQCERLDSGPWVTLSGPGLCEPATVRLGLPSDIVARWQPNHAAFPRGVDLIVCAGRSLAAIPRSIRMEAA